jgi:hypothetical protein
VSIANAYIAFGNEKACVWRVSRRNVVGWETALGAAFAVEPSE